jgi:peptidoglycan/LPS O-acetylase OafA/YrhL/lysophospholipase L1-like esterase
MSTRVAPRPGPTGPPDPPAVSPAPGSPTAAGPTLVYRPALDGVRALAVIAVLVYHGMPGWAPGGFLGVDVFFVLSGYLITSLLVNEAGRRHAVDLGRFWLRRARRLFPVLVLACGVIVLIGWASPRIVDVPTLGADIATTIGYVVNWRFVIAHQDYFAQFAQPSFLRHAWSLAIEEQFYLVWPLVVAGALVWRKVRPSRFAIGCGIAALLSATWMATLYEMGASTSRLYYGTDTRAQALLLGAAFGAAGVGHRSIGSRPKRRAVEGIGLAGLAGVVACVVMIADRTSMLYTGGFALAALCAMALVTDAAQPDASPLGRVLAIAPLVWIGRISYGIYLWHWPVVLLATPDRIGVGGVALFGVRVAITLAVAVASYFLVEQPIRRGVALPGRRFLVAVPMAAVVVLVGGFLVTSNATRLFTPPTAARHLQPAPPPTTTGPSSSTPAVTAPPPPTRVLVVGDSVALTLGVGLGYDQKKLNLTVSNDGILGCGLLRGGQIWVDGAWSNIGANCQQWPTRWASDMSVAKPQVVVVLTGTWDAFDRRVNGQFIPYGSAQADQLLVQDIRDSLNVLAAQGAQVLYMTAPYIVKENDPNPPSQYRSAFDRPRVDHFNQLLQQAIGADPRAEIVDLNGFLAPNGQMAHLRDGKPMQDDGVHLGPEGSIAAAEWLAPTIAAAAVTADERATAATTTTAPTATTAAGTTSTGGAPSG